MAKIIISIATALLLATASHAGNTIVQKTYGNQSSAIIGTNKGVMTIKNDTTYIFSNDLSKIQAPECTVKEIYESLKDLSSVVEPSQGWSSTTLEYRTPADLLRRQAAEIERRDATILKATDVLERCGKYFKEAK